MIQDFQEQLLQILQQLRGATVAYVPRVVAGLLLLLVALVVASVLERALRVILARLKFDNLIQRSGVDEGLHRLGIRHSLNDVLPRLFYFVLMFLFAREAAEVMGLTAVSEAIGRLVQYLPNIVAAFLLLLRGGATAQVAGRGVEELCRGAGLESAGFLGRLTTGLLIFVLVVMALSQLEVETVLVRQLSVLLLGGGVLAVALSFGLGTRDVTRSIIAGFYARQVFDIGEEVEVNGHRGTLEAITATQTLLRSGGRVVVLPNSVFLDAGTSGLM